MAHPPLGALWRHLHSLAESSSLAEAADGQLLERFVTHHEESAFAVLLRRHGPMVLSVCRRALPNEQDREDVFQATFLLLASKANSIRKRESVGSWLHGVAHRLAVQCRVQDMRRRVHEKQATIRCEPESAEQAAWREMQTLLDEAMAALPEKYRTALVLCYLEDHTHEEAARRLGCPLATLRSRVARGRARLRAALIRRGLTLGSTTFLAMLATIAAEASVPASLRNRTLTAVLRFTKGEAAAAMLSPSSAALLREGLKTMSGSKLKYLRILVLTAGVALGGAGLFAHQTRKVDKNAESQAVPPQPVGERAAAGATERKPSAGVDHFGDPLPERALARLGTIRLRHGGIIHAVTFSPDGKLLASTGQHGEVRLWDAATGKKVGALMDPFGSLTQCLAFSPDGKLLASDKGGDAIWDVVTGKKLRNLEAKHSGRVTSMHFSPDGRSLVLGTDDDKSIWFHDPATGKAIRHFEGHQQAVLVAIFSKDGKRLASGCNDGTARLWDQATGKVLHEFKQPATVWDVAFSPDGKLLACKTLKGIHLWDIATRKQLHVFETESSSLRTLAFSPDGKVLASQGTLWDVATGKKRCDCENNYGYSTAFSPDGKIVALGGYNAVVSLHDPATGKELPQSRAGRNRGQLDAVRFTPDGKSLVTLGNNGALIWDRARQQVRHHLKTREFPRSAIAVTPDGTTLALVEHDGALSLWNVASGRELRRIKDEGGNANPGMVPGIAFSPDGKTVASVQHGNIIRLWETATGKELRQFKGHKRDVVFLSISRDGQTLISASRGSFDGSIHFWDVASGVERRRRVQADFLAGISPNGRWCAASPWVDGVGYRGLRVCSLESGKEVCRLEGANGYWCEFSPDGRSIAAAAGEPFAPEKVQTILLFERATGQVRARFRGHLGFLCGAAFSSDGRLLASVSCDTTGLLWDVTGRLCKDRLKEATFSPTELDAFWNDLAGSDAEKAFGAVWALTAASKQAVFLLRERLRPAAPADGKQTARWIADLDSDDFKVREQARQSLEKLEDQAEPALRAVAVKPPSLEVRRQAEQLLEKLESTLSPKRLQALRAIEVLEHIATPEARRLLASLAEGTPQARLTREAKAALGRLR